jgi:hypothetical protein
MATYTAAFEQQASVALAALPADSPITIMITDYGKMRAADRACQQGTRP